MTGVRFALVAMVVLAATAACADPDPDGSSVSESGALERIAAGTAEIVDLTHALSSDMPFWPNEAEANPFRHDTLAAHADGAPIMAALRTPEHHGTHLDAPVHGGPGLASVDELTPGDLFGPAAVVDISAAAARNPNYELSVDDLLSWESRNGRLPDGAIVLAYSGWSRRWDDPVAYRNADDEGAMHFPGFSPEAADFLVTERSIRGIGIDDFSVDPAAADGFPVHGIVNGSGRFHLENVANLHLLPEAGAFLIVAPIKIAGGSGGPVRIYAVLP